MYNLDELYKQVKNHWQSHILHFYVLHNMHEHKKFVSYIWMNKVLHSLKKEKQLAEKKLYSDSYLLCL